MSSAFSNKTIIITGAGGAFGCVCATLFAQESCNLILIDSDATKLEEISTKLSLVMDPSKIHSCAISVTDEIGIERVIRETELLYGGIDYLFNNAACQGDFVSCPYYNNIDFKKIMEINVFGVFNLLQQCSKSMIRTKSKGSIVNVASMAATGAPNMIAYSASKAAVIGLTKSAAKDLAPHNIRVNSVSPSFIGDNDMWNRQCRMQANANSQYYSSDPLEVSDQMIKQIPMRRAGTVEEVIKVAKFLLSEDASYMTGQDIQITGG